MAISVAYNERTEATEAQAEHLSRDYVEDVVDALRGLGHDAHALELTGEAPQVFRRLQEARPDLVFNLAEAGLGAWREAFYPMLYEFLGIPYTGAGPAVLGLGLDKRLTEEALAVAGVEVPKGRLVTPQEPRLPDGLRYPLLVKPNYGGSSQGIHADSIVRTPEEAQAKADALLKDYPEGLDVEEFIEGRELTVGYLAAGRPRLTEVVEYRFPAGPGIMDYETKQAQGAEDVVRTLCPAPLSKEEHERVMAVASRAVAAMRLPDLGRVDLRLDEDGRAVLIEVNPLPGLRRISPLVVGARAQGHSYRDIIGAVVASAARRHNMVLERPP